MKGYIEKEKKFPIKEGNSYFEHEQKSSLSKKEFLP